MLIRLGTCETGAEVTVTSVKVEMFGPCFPLEFPSPLGRLAFGLTGAGRLTALN